MSSTTLAPLHHRLFLWLWLGNAISACGTWIQSTASAWVMTELAPDPLMVSLTQAAAQLPALVLALPAGAIADVVDRRRFLVWTNLGMLAVSGSLAALYLLGMVNAPVLLALTALLAGISALNSPAWSSSVPLTVPRADLPQALVLNSIGYNLARTLGPAVGGAIVAGAGAALAFGANAASFLVIAGIIAFALRFPDRQDLDGVPPERIGRAIGLGIRYAVSEPVVSNALMRSAAFYACASAVWALMPLHVRDVLHLGSGSFGLMFGAIGIGAVLGGLAMPALRSRFTPDTLVMGAGVLTGAAMVPVALSASAVAAMVAMVFYGAGWMVGASSLQSAIQLACAPWVRARGIALYQAVYAGGMGLGAIIWGWLGTFAGLTGTMLAAALGSMAVAVLARSRPIPGDIADPSEPATRPGPRFALDDSLHDTLVEGGHPVFVTIDYIVDPVDEAPFRAAMHELRLARRREGAIAWRLARDLERPHHWIETFRLADWHELRRGASRINRADEAASAAVRAFHRGEAQPSMRIFMTP